MKRKMESSKPPLDLMGESGSTPAAIGGIPAGCKNEQGVALILSLVMLALLGMLGSFALSTSTTEMRVSGNYRTAQTAYYAADLGQEYLKTQGNLFPLNARVPSGIGDCAKNNRYVALSVAGQTLCYNGATRDAVAGKGSGTAAEMGGNSTTVIAMNVIGYGPNNTEFVVEVMRQALR